MEGSPRAVKVLAERSYTASFYERLTGALIRQNNTKISFLSRSPEWKDSKTRSFVGLDGCDLVCRELRLAEKPEGKLGTKHQARKIQETLDFSKKVGGETELGNSWNSLAVRQAFFAGAPEPVVSQEDNIRRAEDCSVNSRFSQFGNCTMYSETAQRNGGGGIVVVWGAEGEKKHFRLVSVLSKGSCGIYENKFFFKKNKTPTWNSLQQQSGNLRLLSGRVRFPRVDHLRVRRGRCAKVERGETRCERKWRRGETSPEIAASRGRFDFYEHRRKSAVQVSTLICGQ